MRALVKLASYAVVETLLRVLVEQNEGLARLFFGVRVDADRLRGVV